MTPERENETNLYAIADLVRGVSYRHPDLVENEIEGVPLLRATNIGEDTLTFDDVLYVPKGHVKAEQLLQRFDTVIAMSSGSRKAVGRLAQLRTDWRGCVGAFCGIIRPKNDKVHPPYLSYVLRSHEYRMHIDSQAVGTAIMNLSKDRVLSYRLRLPPPDEQRSIAAILGALDDKIEQNRRTARVLERLARAIFRAWFVDFEPVKVKAAGATTFPSMPQSVYDALPTRLVDSDIGPVPKGWEVKALDNVANFLNGLALQKYPPRGDGTDLPVIKIAQLRKGSTEGADTSNDSIDEKYKIRDGDLLFSWSGTLEALFWFGGQGALNQHLFKVTSTGYPQWLVYEWIQQHLSEFRLIAASKATTMGHIKRGHLSQALVTVPPLDVLTGGDQILSPLFEAHANSELESRKLVELRDYLLPQLLSGAVRVGEAERLHAAVA